MLSKTSISALRVLTYLAQQEEGACLSPRRIASVLGESPTYLAKVSRHLVKAGILRAEKGVRGGVRMGQSPGEITLLSVVEACQGAIVGDFCQSSRPAASFCGFHRAALELHGAVTGVLSKWTLAHLIESPLPAGELPAGLTCVMARGVAVSAAAGAAAPVPHFGD